MQYIGTLDGYQLGYNTGGNVNFQSSRSSSQVTVNQSGSQSSVGVHRQNSSLITLSPTGSYPSARSSTMSSTSHSSFMSDLEGLDFSLTASGSAPPAPTTESASATAKIYPDISHAFR